MSVSIIIPTYNRNSILYKSLRVLTKSLEGMDAEIIVVNDSKTNEPNMGEFDGMVRLVQNDGAGVAAARNTGVKLAKSEMLIFIDDDIVVNENAIRFICSFLNKNTNACININWVYPIELKNNIQKTKFGRYLVNNGHADLKGWMTVDQWKEDEIYPIFPVASALLGILKTNVTRINGYDESFPFAGFEDYDFAMRLKNNGIIGFLNTSITVLHNEEDRVVMVPWLERRSRNGETRAIGVTKLGYESHRITYSKLKDAIFTVIYLLKSLYFFMLYLVPNTRLTDRLYSKLFNPLLGAYIHHGYMKKQKQLKTKSI